MENNHNCINLLIVQFQVIFNHAPLYNLRVIMKYLIYLLFLWILRHFKCKNYARNMEGHQPSTKYLVRIFLAVISNSASVLEVVKGTTQIALLTAPL